MLEMCSSRWCFLLVPSSEAASSEAAEDFVVGMLAPSTDSVSDEAVLVVEDVDLVLLWLCEWVVVFPWCELPLLLPLLLLLAPSASSPLSSSASASCDALPSCELVTPL